MSEKTAKRYEETKNKGSETVGDDRTPDPIYDLTKNEKLVRAAGPREREDSDMVSHDSPEESRNDKESKLKTTSDVEC